MPTLSTVRRRIVTCTACPRLREYCERVGREKRKAFRDDTYWTKPVPGFGDPRARSALVGSYHPSRQNTHTGRLTPAMLRAVFRTARREADRHVR